MIKNMDEVLNNCDTSQEAGSQEAGVVLDVSALRNKRLQDAVRRNLSAMYKDKSSVTDFKKTETVLSIEKMELMCNRMEKIMLIVSNAVCSREHAVAEMFVSMTSNLNKLAEENKKNIFSVGQQRKENNDSKLENIRRIEDKDTEIKKKEDKLMRMHNWVRDLLSLSKDRDVTIFQLRQELVNVTSEALDFQKKLIDIQKIEKTNAQEDFQLHELADAQKQEIKHLKQDLEALKQGGLCVQMDDLKQDLARKNLHIQALSSKMRDQPDKGEFTILQNQVQEMQKKVRSLSSMVDMKETELQTLQRDLDKNTEQTLVKQNIYDEQESKHQIQIKHFQDALRDEEAKKIKLQRQDELEREEIKRLKRTIKELDTKKTKSKLEKQAQDYAKEISDLKSKLQVSNSLVEKLSPISTETVSSHNSGVSVGIKKVSCLQGVWQTSQLRNCFEMWKACYTEFARDITICVHHVLYMYSYSVDNTIGDKFYDGGGLDMYTSMQLEEKRHVDVLARSFIWNAMLERFNSEISGIEIEDQYVCDALDDFLSRYCSWYEDALENSLRQIFRFMRSQGTTTRRLILCCINSILDVKAKKIEQDKQRISNSR